MGGSDAGGDSGDVMCGGGGGGESEPSRPDICMERKYLVAACLSCSLSSAVWRLKIDNFILLNFLNSVRSLLVQASVADHC